jgi:hypothetical protein
LSLYNQYVEYYEEVIIKNDSIQQQFSVIQKEVSRNIVVNGHYSSEGAPHL